MTNKNIKQKLEDLKRRAKQRQKKMPSAKPNAATVVENQNAIDLMPYVYKLIEVVE